MGMLGDGGIQAIGHQNINGDIETWLKQCEAGGGHLTTVEYTLDLFKRAIQAAQYGRGMGMMVKKDSETVADALGLKAQLQVMLSSRQSSDRTP